MGLRFTDRPRIPKQQTRDWISQLVEAKRLVKRGGRNLKNEYRRLSKPVGSVHVLRPVSDG